mmetsp:Transcript_13490/g.40765  ORF Transcript_13490/g.40765 Transcript_13490/m.40765 type:complete len:81 (-) Transcript_13490:336-578(-)
MVVGESAATKSGPPDDLAIVAAIIVISVVPIIRALGASNSFVCRETTAVVGRERADLVACGVGGFLVLLFLFVPALVLTP